MSISVVAHRGDSEAARENTLEAFRAAVQAGADWVELDIRTTLDGVSVVLHDATTLRLWGRPHEVARVPLAQVRELGYADCRIPTLVEVVEAVHEANQQTGRTVGVLVDTVDASDAVVAQRELAGHQLAGDAVPIRWCGDLAAMFAVRDLDPAARIAYNHPGGELDLATIARLQPETINIEWTHASWSMVDQVHRMGLDLACWTVDDAETMSWLVDLGIDAITSNRPRLLRRLLSQGTSPLAMTWAGADELAVRAGITLEAAEWTAAARELGRWACRYTRTAALGAVHTKAHPADVVTAVDTAVETHVREVIAQLFPDHLVVGEEMGGESQPGRPTWYLDPVDGTTNLANTLPWTSMSLALAIDHDPVVAVVAHPWLDQVFLAVRGLGATVDGRPLDVARASDLAGRTVLTELAAHQPWPGMDSFVANLAEHHATTRVMGSGTLALTSVAAGWAAGAVVHEFNPIDHLAGVLISHEAGAMVLDDQGQPTLFPQAGGVLVSCPGVDGLLHRARGAR